MKRILPFLLLIAIFFLYTYPFFRPGYFPTHDGEWAIVRLAEMVRELRDGQFPARWAGFLNHGYGYPLFSFTYPLPYYIGAAIHYLGLGFTDTIKTIFVASVFLSGAFMFLLGKELGGKWGGFYAAIFYMTAPFRLVDLYVRGSIGESLSLVFFPLLCFLGIRFVTKPNVLWMALTSLTLALFILTHNVMSLVFVPLWILFLYVVVISYSESITRYSWRYFLPLLLLGLGLSFHFFFPALVEKKHVALSQVKLADQQEHFLVLSDFVNSQWSFENKPSFQLGYVHIAAFGLALLFLLSADAIDRKKHYPTGLFIVVSVLGLIFFTQPSSYPFWVSTFLSNIDFPWRLLTPMIFFLSVMTAFFALHRRLHVVGLILAVAAVAYNFQFVKTNGYFVKVDSFYLTNDATTTSADELMPIWVKEKPKNRFDKKIEVLEGEVSIEQLTYNSRQMSFMGEAAQPSKVRINTIYFPGWEMTINNTLVAPDYSNAKGVMDISIPQGKYQVTGVFRETPVRLWSNMISLVSLGICGLLLIVSSAKWILALSSKPQGGNPSPEGENTSQESAESALNEVMQQSQAVASQVQAQGEANQPTDSLENYS